MNTIKTLAAIGMISTLPGSVFAQEQPDINYGDPLASIKTLGISASDQNSAQLNGIYGYGSHIGILDLTSTGKHAESGAKEGTAYRARYLNVSDGLGLSVDLIGSSDKSTESNIGVASAVYKFQVGNWMVFPMAGLGQMEVKQKGDGNSTYTTAVAQPGVHLMYAFDEGHWLYANPKVTHAFDAPNGVQNFDKNTWEMELGGGYMLNDWSSAEFKIENKFANSTPGSKDNTTAWVKYAVYF